LGEAPTVAVGRHALADTPTSEHPQSVIEDADATAARVLLPARAATVTLQWDTGSRVTVGGVVLVGRDPHPAAGEQVDRRLSVGADAIGVSKTHLALTVTTDGITVLDRHSTNGTRIERSGGEIVSCPPGEPIGVRDGDRILFGGRSIEVAPA
jgi:pSer/pThr/pTyr-binding forkhead associated (FHA) protein